MSIVFALERTNQLSLLPDKDLVDLCTPVHCITQTEEPKFACNWNNWTFINRQEERNYY
ncbi:MAG: hypothetical protein ACKPJT_20020 [Microcystis panniformis]